MASAVKRFLLSPRVPSNAAGFIEQDIVVVDLRRTRGALSLAGSAFTELPDGLVEPSFDGVNIHDPDTLAALFIQTAEAAGLKEKKRWSASLPEGVARTLLVTLESKPSGRRELDEVLLWKIERALGVSGSNLRLARQRLSPLKGQDRYLMTVTSEPVISEYELVFAKAGWNVGLLLPKHIGEADWLLADKTPGDKMLVSATPRGFIAIIVRRGEPVLVRAEECEPEAIADELYRIALFYRDRVPSAAHEEKTISHVLILGRMDRGQVIHSVTEALGKAPELVESDELGLDLKSEPVSFDHLAAVAGLAARAWQG
jgi:hypothetical protein